MTERLYLADPYLTAFKARIVERRQLPPDARLAVILDRTAFSPSVAGVASDTGMLGDSHVTEVIQAEKGLLLHVISQEIWNDEIEGSVDWPRRFDLMQHHTAQHILSEALVQLYGAETASATVSPQAAFIELNKVLSDAEVERAASWANDVVSVGRAVRVAMVDPTRVSGVSDSQVMRKQPVRVFNIEGFRLSVCHASHVSRTSEVGLLRVVKINRVVGRSRNWMRIDFECGLRVMGSLYEHNQVVLRLASLLSVPPSEVEQTVVNLKTQAVQAVDIVSGLHSKLLEYETIALDATAERVGNLRVVSRVFPDRDVAETKQLVRLLCERPGLVVLVGTANARAQLFFGCSPDVKVDMSVLIKAAAQVLGTTASGEQRWAESMLSRADEGRVEAALSKAHNLLQVWR